MGPTKKSRLSFPLKPLPTVKIQDECLAINIKGYLVHKITVDRHPPLNGDEDHIICPVFYSLTLGVLPICCSADRSFIFDRFMQTYPIR